MGMNSDSSKSSLVIEVEVIIRLAQKFKYIRIRGPSPRKLDEFLCELMYSISIEKIIILVNFHRQPQANQKVAKTLSGDPAPWPHAGYGPDY